MYALKPQFLIRESPSDTGRTDQRTLAVAHEEQPPQTLKFNHEHGLWQ